MDFAFPDLREAMGEFLARGLVISPWLRANQAVGRFDAGIFEYIDREALSYANAHWTKEEQARIYGDTTPPDRLARTAVYEIVASTAASLAHQLTGRMHVDTDMAEKALRMTTDFSDQFGFGTLILLYALVTSYENEYAVNYYGQIPQREFELGSWHRPWVDYSLQDELQLGVIFGVYRITEQDGVNYVELTDEGRALLAKTERTLQESGYLKKRVHQLQMSQFDLFADYDQMTLAVAPDAAKFRLDFTDWSKIQVGMKVLEIGCADGVYTFEGELAQRVGPSGHVTAIDQSAAMIKRAEARRKRMGVDWVEFIQADAHALPFPDNSFDVVTCSGVLHFTDQHVFLSEARRVLLAGGFVVSTHPTKFNFYLPFFKEWFAPILQLAAARQDAETRDFLSYPEEIVSAFKNAGLENVEHVELCGRILFTNPNNVIRHFIHGVGWFQEELATLPWKRREEVIAELEARGHVVVGKYPEQDLVVGFPCQMVKGYKPL